MSNVIDERNRPSFLDLIISAGSGWVVPEDVHVEAERLVYRWADSNAPRRVKVRLGILKRFTALAAASPEAIADFACTWGVLGPPVARPAPGRGNADESGGNGWYEEPLSAWRERAAGIGAAQRIAHEIALGRRGSPQDWHMLVRATDKSWGMTLQPVAPTPRQLPAVFCFLLSSWLQTAGLGLELSWQPPQRPTLEFRTGNYASVWGGVVQALITDLIGEEARYVVCGSPGCGQLIAKATLAPGRRRVYCLTCRENRRDPGAARRVAELRERRRRVRELRAEGLSLAAIAERMGFHDTPKRTANLDGPRAAPPPGRDV